MSKTGKSKKTVSLNQVNPVRVVKRNPFATYLSQSLDEFKKVIWPTRNEAIRLTIVVIVASALIGAILTIIDIGLAKAVDALLKI